MSKHEYLSNKYIASTLVAYGRHPSHMELGYNLRDVKQSEDSVVLKIGKASCKININGMVKDDPTCYYSKLELSMIDNKQIEPETKNLILNIKRSKNGRVAGNHFNSHKDYMKAICIYSENYQKGITAKLAEEKER